MDFWYSEKRVGKMNDNFDTLEYLNNMDAVQRVMIYTLGVSEKPLNKMVQIQKLLFLTSKSLPEILGEHFDFQKHKKGPYAEAIEENMKIFSSSGLIEGMGFGLSKRGYGLYNIVESKVKEPLKSTIADYKNFISELSEDELLTFIYVRFPEHQKNSEEWKRLEADRVSRALSMLKKGVISASLAAEIANMNYFDFEELARKEGIRWKID